MNYEWNILHIKTKNYDGMPNVVYSARVEYVGTTEAGEKGTYELLMTFPQPALENFIQYEDLTPEIMNGWFDRWMSGDEQHFGYAQAKIQHEIDNGIVKRLDFPWL